MRRIPNGTVLNLVRVNFKTVPVRVSHQGIVIVKGGRRHQRRAADRMYHSVVDERLDRFVDRMSAYKRWPVAGIHLSRIIEPVGCRDLLRPTPPQKGTLWISAPAYGDGIEQMTIDPALMDAERCMEAEHGLCRSDASTTCARSATQ